MAAILSPFESDKENVKILCKHHIGILECRCGHQLGRVPFPLDKNYFHSLKCTWSCCSGNWEKVSCATVDGRRPEVPKTVDSDDVIESCLQDESNAEIVDSTLMQSSSITTDDLPITPQFPQLESGISIDTPIPEDRSILREKERFGASGQIPSEFEMIIRDRYREYKGYIAPDGTCLNTYNETIGYINIGDGTAGDKSEQLLGSIIDQLVEDECVVENASGDRLASVNLGSSRILDNQGSTIAEFDATGHVVGNHGSSLCHVEGFNFGKIRTAALYMLFIEPTLLNEM